MPASELEWSSLSHRTPFHNVFPTKRKATSEYCLENTLQQDIADEHNTKRRCFWSNPPQLPQSQPAQPMFHEAMMPEVNHNDSDMNFNNNNNNSLPVTPVQAQPQVFQTLRAQSQPNRVPSPWPSDQSVQAHQNTYHPQYMDTAGETCNGQAQAQSEDMEAACMSMDSDCVPNPQQYSSTSERHEHKQDSEYCKQYCGAGEESPTSGRIRCYCKPSWEGMMDLKPYISDVY